ncbi:dihydrofolate reductase [Zafaria cholistanensis]|uniref:dihydrofolate reductase n=1 Tax=Zafaria cholistanensis TaxID=1682741 RepID=A0A5A7NP92_9MICC|nr:dihydrofolate reductase [Zafaria cholistanensis]GER21551.1 dihydrofolate reductase [Zafaria cholistanensis]
MSTTSENPTLSENPGPDTAPAAAAHRAEAATQSRLGMIWARSVDGVIGHEGRMPWHLPEDLAHFKRTTLGRPIIMGRRTWESLPEAFRPLPGRTNVVLTSDKSAAAAIKAAGAIVAASPEAALEAARAAEGSEEIWVVGGGQVYAAFAGLADTAVVTVVNATPAGDTRAPELGEGWKRTLAEPDAGWLASASGLEYRYELWEKTA